MNGNQNIINKILSDAEARCAEIKASAQAAADAAVKKAIAQTEQESKNADARIEKMREESLRNAMSAAQLNARKYALQQKQKIISSCYEKALQRMAESPADKRREFIAKIIRQYAEKGERVYICAADKDVVTQKFLDGFALDLTLGKKYLSAKGGVVLEGEGYDKDLTLEKLVDYVRGGTEAQVAHVLFGE